MSSISVVVGTFGDESWRETAEAAVSSAIHQTVPPESIHQVHKHDLMTARNKGAEMATGDWLCFLDADDTLDSHYIEAMEKKISTVNEMTLLQPSHRNDKDRTDGKAGEVVLYPPKDIKRGNFLIIGTVVSKSLFQAAGGFRNLPIYEDWDLWIRCFNKGATYVTVPEAIYEITVRPEGRNNHDRSLAVKVSNDIRRRYR